MLSAAQAETPIHHGDDDSTASASADSNALVDAHDRDMETLTKPGTRAAYGPFAIEYKECLQSVYNGDLPNTENAYRFLLFHAYQPVRRKRKKALGAGRFCMDEWRLVTKDSRYIAGLVAEKNKDQFVISRGHLAKVRSAILLVVKELCPNRHRELSDDVRMKDLLRGAVLRKNCNKKLNYKEKANTRIHSLEAEPLRRDVESYMWNSMSEMGARDLCAHLRHRATLNVTMTTLLRNDSWKISKLSDMAYYRWHDSEEETPYDLLNFEVSSKTSRDSEKPETASSFRHLDPRYCPQGSIAFYLYYRFIVSHEPETWDFLDNESWFDTKVNVSIGDKQTCAVMYDKIPSKNTYYSKLKEAAEFYSYAFEHWEHFGRYYGVAILELARVARTARAGHGGWEKKIFDNHYSTGIEVSALLGAAGFKPDVRGTHRNPRVSILPPQELVDLVWPWIEMWEEKLRAHPDGHKRVTAHRFLRAMKHLRIVLLQDAAWFFMRGRDSHAFFHLSGTVFHDPLFQEWAETFHRELSLLEEPSQDPNFKVLERVNAAVAGHLTSLKASHESTARKVDHLMKVSEATGGTLLSSSVQLNELHRFQQYAALHHTQTAAYASSLPPFDPNRNYHWPVHNVQRTTINAITPSPTATRATEGSPVDAIEGDNLTERFAQSEQPPEETAEAPKVFPHCHNGSLEVVKDYLGMDDSIFRAHGGMKSLRNNVSWYRNLRPNKKENETAKSYVRRICGAGERILSLIEDDMEAQQTTFQQSLVTVCATVDQKAAEGSKNKRYVSLTKIIDSLGKMGNG
jgi:hypothetical protein